MTLKIALAAAAGLIALSVAGAPVAAAKSPLEPTKRPARQCFWNHQVHGFAAPNDRTVNVRVGVRDVYQFEMFGPCIEVDWAHRIALVSRGGGSYICDDRDVEIVTPTSIGPQRCTIRHMRKLTPAEIAALPKHGKP